MGYGIIENPLGALSHGAESTLKTYQSLAELQALVGSVLGTRDWIAFHQARIDQFAAVTGDDEWIHVDPARMTVNYALNRARFPAAHKWLWKSPRNAGVMQNPCAWRSPWRDISSEPRALIYHCGL